MGLGRELQCLRGRSGAGEWYGVGVWGCAHERGRGLSRYRPFPPAEWSDCIVPQRSDLVLSCMWTSLGGPGDAYVWREDPWPMRTLLWEGGGGLETTGLREDGNNTGKSTGRSGRQNAATQRNMRREGRVTVQGPVKAQQPDGMSHRGGLAMAPSPPPHPPSKSFRSPSFILPPHPSAAPPTPLPINTPTSPAHAAAPPPAPGTPHTSAPPLPLLPPGGHRVHCVCVCVCPGAFNQIGKFYVGPDLRLRARCFSWCRTANCLFVDSPVMTGFSYQTNASGGFDRDRVEYTATSAAAAEQVLQVLLQFLRLWPEHRRAPYYVQGLSYAGIYVPHMARAVLRHNRRGGAPRIDLRGIAAGDPVMDNAYQYPTYAPALEALGLLMEDEARRVDAIMRRAARWSARDCARSFAEWNRVWNDDGGSSCAPHCEFLFRRFTGSENTEHVLLGAQPRAFAHFRRFLMGHVAAFHVAGSPVLRGPGPALAEGGAVYAAMVRSGDLCGPSAPLYASLFLDEGLDVVVYAGNMDPLLGPAMTAAGVRAAWDYAAANVSGGAAARAAFYRREKQVWRIAATDAAPAGYAKCLERPGHRFCYVVVRGAGHEAASYAPRAMYDLNERFLHRRAFAGDAPAGGTPQCAPCGGAPPFAGGAVAACADVPPLW